MLDKVQAYDETLVEKLRKLQPENTQPLPDETLIAYVSEHQAKAQRYGLKTTRNILRYLEYTLIFSPDFDNNPKTHWARAILNSPKLSGREKIERLDNYYTFTLKG